MQPSGSHTGGLLSYEAPMATETRERWDGVDDSNIKRIGRGERNILMRQFNKFFS